MQRSGKREREDGEVEHNGQGLDSKRARTEVPSKHSSQSSSSTPGALSTAGTQTYEAEVAQQLERIGERKDEQERLQEQRRKLQLRMAQVHMARKPLLNDSDTPASPASDADTDADEEKEHDDDDDDEEVDDESSTVILVSKEASEDTQARPSSSSNSSNNNSNAREDTEGGQPHTNTETQRGKGQESGMASGNSSASSDMFASTSPASSGSESHTAVVAAVRKGSEENSTLQDNWDDAEGYYVARLGELLAQGRYKLISKIGRGVFSTVVRSEDTHTGQAVAIKLIRNNEVMHRAGMREIELLKRLMKDDPEGKKHCVRMLDHFEERGHLCLVFESMAMNARELLRKFGKNVGLSVQAVRVYAKQMLIALRQLKQLGIMHADIKLDNMVVNEQFNVMKLCDFGSASPVEENDITPYLVSRFYRAPEIILGMRYDCALDMWSVGCCLYELFTGKVCFPGKDNNDMLRLFQETKGRFPNRMLRKGELSEGHFDGQYFLHQTDDKINGQQMAKRLLFTEKPNRPVADRLFEGFKPASGEEAKRAKLLADLLDKMFVLDPSKRISVGQALKHPFLKA